MIHRQTGKEVFIENLGKLENSGGTTLYRTLTKTVSQLTGISEARIRELINVSAAARVWLAKVGFS